MTDVWCPCSKGNSWSRPRVMKALLCKVQSVKLTPLMSPLFPESIHLVTHGRSLQQLQLRSITDHMTLSDRSWPLKPAILEPKTHISGKLLGNIGVVVFAHLSYLKERVIAELEIEEVRRRDEHVMRFPREWLKSDHEEWWRYLNPIWEGSHQADPGHFNKWICTPF